MVKCTIKFSRLDLLSVHMFIEGQLRIDLQGKKLVVVQSEIIIIGLLLKIKTEASSIPNVYYRPININMCFAC